MNKYVPGMGCHCCAHSENECCCPDVDWRSEREVELEAIVAAKDAEIERLKAMLPDIPKAERECRTLEDWKARALYFESEYASCSHGFNSHAGKQAERIKELEADLAEEAHIRDRMAHLLAETAVALKGPEKALHRHGWQDLPEAAIKLRAELAHAKLFAPAQRTERTPEPVIFHPLQKPPRMTRGGHQ